MDNLNIIFYGTPQYAVTILEALINEPTCNVLAVVSQPDKKVGRKQIITPPPVKELAEKHSIPVFQPTSCKSNDQLLSELKAFSPDIQIVAAYGHILPKELLEIAPYGSINVHGSLLPKYRGASPVQSAILNGDTTTGVTIMQMDETMDTGDILSAQEIPIDPDDTTETLMPKVASEGASTLIETLKLLSTNYSLLTPLPQNDSDATYCQKITRQNGEIHWNEESAEEIYNKLRAFTPWPGCFTFYNDKRLKILKATHLKELPNSHHNTRSTSHPPGQLEVINKHEFAFICKEGFLQILELQPEGKNPMKAEAFIQGLSFTTT